MKYSVLANIALLKESLSQESGAAIGPGYYAAKGVEWAGNTSPTAIENAVTLIRFGNHSKCLEGLY